MMYEQGIGHTFNCCTLELEIGRFIYLSWRPAGFTLWILHQLGMPEMHMETLDADFSWKWKRKLCQKFKYSFSWTHDSMHHYEKMKTVWYLQIPEYLFPRQITRKSIPNWNIFHQVRCYYYDIIYAWLLQYS